MEEEAAKEITELKSELAESRKLLEEAKALLARKEKVTIGDEQKSLFESILSMEKLLKSAGITIIFNERGIATDK